MNLENTFKALGETSRLRIVMLLLDKTLCGFHIEKTLRISQTNVSRHIAKLKQAGILQEKRCGQRCHFSIHRDFQKEKSILYDYLLSIRVKNPVYINDSRAFEGMEDCGCEGENCSCHGKPITEK